MTAWQTRSVYYRNEAETIAERFILMPPNATMSFGQNVRARRKALAAQILRLASDAYDKGRRDLLVNDIAPDVKQDSGR